MFKNELIMTQTMFKPIFLVTVLFYWANYSIAQCSISQSLQGPFDYYPNAQEGETFMAAGIGSIYSDHLEFIFPATASEIDSGLPSLLLDSISIEGINASLIGAEVSFALADIGLDYTCNNNGDFNNACTFNSGQQYCILLSGVPNQNGTFNLTMQITIYTQLFGNTQALPYNLELSTIAFGELNCSEIFISEYVEGSDNNRAIELYNPTENPIDLSSYRLERYSNGSFSTQPNQRLDLEGIIQPNDVWVIVIDKRNPGGTGTETPIDPALEAIADIFADPIFVEGNTMYFNGNDALVLRNGDTVIDTFGKVGQDPGDPADGGGWNDISPDYTWTSNLGVAWTTNHTMIRKVSITEGDINPIDAFDPSLEYDSLPNNTFSHLGLHDCLCNGIALIPGCTDPLACNFNPLATVDDGSCLLASGCTDPTACNFDPAAECDDGSCLQFDQCGNCGGFSFAGCTDPEAENFNPIAACDDGSCIYTGCMYSQACNYNPLATIEDMSCVFPGCTDPTALNYEPNAGCEGECFFATNSDLIMDGNGDCVVNSADLILLLVEFGSICE